MAKKALSFPCVVPWLVSLTVFHIHHSQDFHNREGGGRGGGEGVWDGLGGRKKEKENIIIKKRKSHESEPFIVNNTREGDLLEYRFRSVVFLSRLNDSAARGI